MPTVAGLDGVEKEISMEELKQTVQNGGRLAYVQRTVTGLDGKIHTRTIYGNKPDGDGGADWSVNLFVDLETFTELVRIFIEEVGDPNHKADPEESLGDPEVAYLATVDFTDRCLMGELTLKKDVVTLTVASRNEQKALFGQAMRGQWKNGKDGISVNFDPAGEDKTPIYLFGILKALKYLKKSGQLDQLKKLENRSAGAIVTAKKDSGTISARIVRGRQRPNLPCITGFLGMGGEQMCRPYLDELLGIADMMPLEQRVELAEDGDTGMMETLAMAYLNGDGVDADPEKAAHWFQKLAEAGESNGMFNLGLLYAKGHGVKRDFAQAAHWMELAATHGDTDAPPMAEQYRKMADGLQKAEAGDAQAQADLASGLMSLGGSLDQAGAGDDYAQSAYWAKKAAEQNNGDGIWTLALAYEHGRGVKQNKKKAVELYRRGAELGHAACQHSLGCYYMRGEVVPKDEKEGFRLILKSAEQGYGLAMRDAGRCYQFGNGVQDDMGKAIEWYEKALQVIDDEELARKVALFKMLEGSGGFDSPISRVPKLSIDVDSLVPTSKKVLANKRFAVTGEMSVFPVREEFKAFIASHGGWLTGSVSSKTDYLITNEPDSGSVKNRQAKQLGVKVISEKQFFDMLRDKKKTAAKATPASTGKGRSKAPKQTDQKPEDEARLREQKRRQAQDRKAEEERKHRQAQERKAEEERRRRQAQARKAEEEEKKRQQEQAKEAAYKAWQEQTARCREQREQEVKQLMDEKRRELRADMDRRLDEKLAEADEAYTALQEQKRAAEQMLASLGLFKIGAKKEARAEIERLNGELAKAQEKRAAIIKEYNREAGGLEQQLAGQGAAIQQQANEKYPMPAEPEKPKAILEKERQEAARHSDPAELENQMLRDKIIAVMEPGQRYTLSQLAEMVPDLAGASALKMFALIKPIVNDPGKGIYDLPLNKIIEQRKSYYCLA